MRLTGLMNCTTAYYEKKLAISILNTTYRHLAITILKIAISIYYRICKLRATVV